MCRLLASIAFPLFKHVIPCYVENIAMAMVKASTPPHRLRKLSYDLGVVVYTQTETLE